MSWKPLGATVLRNLPIHFFGVVVGDSWYARCYEEIIKPTVANLR